LIGVSCQSQLYVQQKNVQYLTIADAQAEDTSMVRMIKPYKEQIEQRMSKVIGVAKKELKAERNDIESTLGNFVADLIQQQAQKIAQQPIDFAIVNNGSLRVPISAGNITLGNIYELMPFENELVLIQLKGKDVFELLAYEGQFRKTSFSNMQLRYTPEGQLVEALLGGKKIEPEQTYCLATYDYLGNGGDGMNCLRPFNKEVIGVTLRSAIIQQIEELHAAGKEIDAAIERRVLFR
jgi:2',3'-cyclic-nucleotide 2'-phosphodiesterase (5'-nucleotidase family)